MGKKIIPSASEVREYLEKEDAARKMCIKNGESYVITGSKFLGGKYLAIQDYAAFVGGGGKRWRIQGRNMGTLQEDCADDTHACYKKGISSDVSLCTEGKDCGCRTKAVGDVHSSF